MIATNSRLNTNGLNLNVDIDIFQNRYKIFCFQLSLHYLVHVIFNSNYGVHCSVILFTTDPSSICVYQEYSFMLSIKVYVLDFLHFSSTCLLSRFIYYDWSVFTSNKTLSRNAGAKHIMFIKRFWPFTFCWSSSEITYWFFPQRTNETGRKRLINIMCLTWHCRQRFIYASTNYPNYVFTRSERNKHSVCYDLVLMNNEACWRG